MSEHYHMEGTDLIGPAGERLGTIPNKELAASTLRFLNRVTAGKPAPQTAPLPQTLQEDNPKDRRYARRYIHAES